jgi:hypothetical protein
MADIINQPQPLAAPATDFAGLEKLLRGVVDITDRFQQASYNAAESILAIRARVFEACLQHRERMYVIKAQHEAIFREQNLQILEKIYEAEGISYQEVHCPILQAQVRAIMQGKNTMVGLLCPRYRSMNKCGEKCHVPEDDYQGSSRMLKGIHRKLFITHAPCQFEDQIKPRKDSYYAFLEMFASRTANDLQDPPLGLPYNQEKNG